MFHESYVWQIGHRKSSKHEWGFIPNFHVQYKEIGNIFKQHWHLLCIKKALNQVLPRNPSFICRKALNFGDKVVKKVLDPPVRPEMFWDRAGFFACRRCQTCVKVNQPIHGLSEFISTANNMSFKMKEFITCNTTHVVYVLQ